MWHLKERLIDTTRKSVVIDRDDNFMINRMILFSWPFFAIYLCTQPLLSNWANNHWYNYTAEYTVYNRNGTVEGSYIRPGMCDTDAQYMHCTDGQNFTELALRYRGKAVGCGCGQGFLGEGLCPMTSYGYTLSDFVSTEPGIAAMLGLGFFPLLGTWKNTMIINKLAKPTLRVGRVHMLSMAVFQVSYILWGIASDCIFPIAHSVLTVIFLGSFFLHWVITAIICAAGVVSKDGGHQNIETWITACVAVFAITIMLLGAVPRVFLSANAVIGTPVFPNLNYFPLSYSFWAAEALGLSATFGAYPICLLWVYFFPMEADLNHDRTMQTGEQSLFMLHEGAVQAFKEGVRSQDATGAQA